MGPWCVGPWRLLVCGSMEVDVEVGACVSLTLKNGLSRLFSNPFKACSVRKSSPWSFTDIVVLVLSVHLIVKSEENIT